MLGQAPRITFSIAVFCASAASAQANQANQASRRNVSVTVLRSRLPASSSAPATLHRRAELEAENDGARLSTRRDQLDTKPSHVAALDGSAIHKLVLPVAPDLPLQAETRNGYGVRFFLTAPELALPEKFRASISVMGTTRRQWLPRLEVKVRSAVARTGIEVSTAFALLESPRILESAHDILFALAASEPNVTEEILGKVWYTEDSDYEIKHLEYAGLVTFAFPLRTPAVARFAQPELELEFAATEDSE